MHSIQIVTDLVHYRNISLNIVVIFHMHVHNIVHNFMHNDHWTCFKVDGIIIVIIIGMCLIIDIIIIVIHTMNVSNIIIIQNVFDIFQRYSYPQFFLTFNVINFAIIMIDVI